MGEIIRDVRSYLAVDTVDANLADATRKVEMVGMVVVEVICDDGITGVGLTYHEVGGDGIRSFIEREIKPRVIGRSVYETEVLFYEFMQYARGVGRKGMAFCAYSALDIALWDIKGKLCGQPLYRMFGGNNPNVRVYDSGGWTSFSDEELVEDALRMVSDGYSIIKVKVGVEGGGNPMRDVKRIYDVRKAVGDDVEILVDANNVWTAATAVRVANCLRDARLLCFEEPVCADDIPGLIRFKQGTDVPLASGEHEYTRYGARDLLMAQAIDIVQMDAARCGGFTELNKAIAMTQAFNVQFAPHCMEYIHMHAIAAADNGLFVERLSLFKRLTSTLFPTLPLPVNGVITIPDKPGLGFELDHDALKSLVL